MLLLEGSSKILGWILFFAANEILGPSVVSTNVMNGSHYVRARRGMTLLSQAMSSLQLVQFFKIKDCSLYDTLLQQIVKYQELFKEQSPDPVKIKEEWENVRVCFRVFRMILKNSRDRDARKVNHLDIGHFLSTK